MFQATNTKNHSQKYIKLLNMYICMFMHKYTIIRSCVQAMSCDVFSSDHMSQQAKNSPLEYIFVHRIFLPNNVKVRIGVQELFHPKILISSVVLRYYCFVIMKKTNIHLYMYMYSKKDVSWKCSHLQIYELLYIANYSFINVIILSFVGV